MMITEEDSFSSRVAWYAKKGIRIFIVAAVAFVGFSLFHFSGDQADAGKISERKQATKVRGPAPEKWKLFSPEQEATFTTMSLADGKATEVKQMGFGPVNNKSYF